MRFAYETRPAHVVFGAGRAAEGVAAAAERLGLCRILLVSSLRESNHADRLAAPLGDRVVGRYTGVRQHVPAAVADEVRSVAAEVGADGILSIGGGSTTGTAKILALSAGIPIVAVPTTYAGSEMTPVWGLTTDGRKETGVDARVQPREVIYDSDLVAELPDEVAVVSALNAMAHCIEATWSLRASPITSTLAVDGIRSLARGLHGVRDPASRARAVDHLQYGSMLGGLSLASVGSGLHHKICHALGGAFDLPHAPTHAVVLPFVVAYTVPAVPEIASRIAGALGAGNAADGLRAVARRAGAPLSLAEIGLRREQLPEAIAVVQARLPIDGPRTATAEDIAELLAAAFEGPARR